MRFSTLLALALSTASSAQASGFWGGGQTVMADDLKIPGSNPLYFCEDPKDNILTIENVDLSPNPPQAGKTLSISAKGELSETIEDGAKVHLQVKYGLITLINQNADLCEQGEKVDLECPLEKGELVFNKDVNLPREIPPGHYTVLADVKDKDGNKITCLTAKITFGR